MIHLMKEKERSQSRSYANCVSQCVYKYVSVCIYVRLYLCVVTRVRWRAYLLARSWIVVVYILVEVVPSIPTLSYHRPEHTPHTVTRYLLLNFVSRNLVCLVYPPNGRRVYGSIELKSWEVEREDCVDINFAR